MPSLPTVDTYLASLPAGIDSYPDALVKASTLAIFKNHLALLDLVQHAPPEAGRLITDAPTVTSWVSEVHFNVLNATFYDLVFREHGGFTALEEWATEQNVKLLGNPLYRILFAAVGPKRLINSVSMRWSVFRRGTTLSVVGTEAKSVEVELVFPTHLEPATTLSAFTGVFRATMRIARVDAVSVALTDYGETSARWRIEWR